MQGKAQVRKLRLVLFYALWISPNDLKLQTWKFFEQKLGKSLEKSQELTFFG
jgi:hypothetical protein